MQEDLLKLLTEFSGAWNRHDADALLAMMIGDGVFDTAAGADPWGARHAGRDALAQSFRQVWDSYPDARWTGVTHFVAGDRGASTWTFTGTDTAGRRVEVNGIDVFTFRGGLIARKDTYRKNRS